MLVVWDTASGIPIKSIFNPHPNGVIAVDISPDALFIVTLSAPAPAEGDNSSEPQMISLWEWTHPERQEALFTSVIDEPDVQKVVKFNSCDVRHIVTTGDRKTMFWGWEDGGLRGTSQAITVSSIGEIIVWDEAQTAKTISAPGDNGDNGDNGVTAEAAQFLLHRPKRQAVKVLKLCDGAIAHVSTVTVTGGSGNPEGHEEDGATTAGGDQDSNTGVVAPGAGATTYVVVAGEDGAVRFYDLKFRLEAWFEDFDAGGVTSVSFATSLPPRLKGDSDSGFRVPDFVVGTDRAYIVACAARAFEELDPERRRGSVLVQGMVGSVTCVAAHPKLPRLVILCDSDATDLEEVASFRYSAASLSSIRFSPDGEMVAACDTDNHVLLFKHSVVDAQQSANAEEFYTTNEDEEAQPKDTWAYVGRHRSHSRAITGLEFGTREDGRVSLVSVGEDRFLVEYNLPDSNQETGLLMAEVPRRIEQGGLPTALLWHPLLGSDFEDRLVTANNEYKLKQWNADNKNCRRTTIGPTFGGPINRLVQINHIHTDGQPRPTEFVAYGTADKVVGLVQLPFDGNSHKMMGLIAHPGEISSLSVSGDGNYLITAGGKDLTVNVWKINTQAVQDTASNKPSKNQAEIAMGGGSEREDVEVSSTCADDMTPFLEQLQGGEGGDLHEELVDYFFYAVLRTQGEDTTEERSTASVVPVAEVPNIMRALGYYPTEQEVAHMSNEVKYSRFTETGEVVDSVDLNGLIRLFVNHRPVFPVSKQVISDAFSSMGGDPHDGGRLGWSTICAKLQSMGEQISEEELVHCLEALTGDSSTTRMNGRQTLHPMQFAEEVLGFEDHRQPRNHTNTEPDSMQNVNGGRCAGPDCSKQPRFSMPGEKGKYCSKHREPGMVDVLYTPCAAQGCKKHPHFGHIEGGPRYCAQHRAEGMVDVKHRRCAVKSCRKDRMLIPGSANKRGKFCEVHCDENELVNKDPASSDGASTTNDKKRSRSWIPDREDDRDYMSSEGSQLGSSMGDMTSNTPYDYPSARSSLRDSIHSIHSIHDAAQGLAHLAMLGRERAPAFADHHPKPGSTRPPFYSGSKADPERNPYPLFKRDRDRDTDMVHSGASFEAGRPRMSPDLRESVSNTGGSGATCSPPASAANQSFRLRYSPEYSTSTSTYPCPWEFTREEQGARWAEANSAHSTRRPMPVRGWSGHPSAT
eukprot:g5347.t1